EVDEGQSTNPLPAIKAPSASSANDATTPLSPVGADVSRPAPIDRPFTPPDPASPSEPPVGASAERSGARFNSFAPPEPGQTSTGAQPAITPPGYDPISPLPATSTTGMLALSNFQQGNTGTLKLTGPAKIVQVPVAGQPGLYVTGLF